MEQIQESNPIVTLSPSEAFTQNFIQPNLESFTFAKQVLETVIDKGSQKIYQHYLRTKVPQHYAEFLTNTYEEVIVQEIRSYDPGETIDSYLINWGDEDEPVSFTYSKKLINKGNCSIRFLVYCFRQNDSI